MKGFEQRRSFHNLSAKVGGQPCRSMHLGGRPGHPMGLPRTSAKARWACQAMHGVAEGEVLVRLAFLVCCLPYLCYVELKQGAGSWSCSVMAKSRDSNYDKLTV